MKLALKVQRHVRLSPNMVEFLYDNVLSLEYDQWLKYFEDTDRKVKDFTIDKEHITIVYRVNLSWRLITILDVFI